MILHRGLLDLRLGRRVTLSGQRRFTSLATFVHNVIIEAKLGNDPRQPGAFPFFASGGARLLVFADLVLRGFLDEERPGRRRTSALDCATVSLQRISATSASPSRARKTRARSGGVTQPTANGARLALTRFRRPRAHQPGSAADSAASSTRNSRKALIRWVWASSGRQRK